MNRRRASLAAILGLAAVLVAAPATPALAHHSTITGTAVCNQQTGLFDLSWTVENWKSGSPLTVVSSTGGIVPAKTVIDTSAMFPQPGVKTGTYSLTVAAKWADGVTSTNTGKVTVAGSCKKPTPTPTPTPTQTVTPSPTPTVTPTTSPSPTASPTPTTSPTPTASPSPTSTPTASPTPTSTPTPNVPPTSTPSPTATAVAPPAPTPIPSTSAAPARGELPATGTEPVWPAVLLGVLTLATGVTTAIIARRRQKGQR